MSIVIRMHPYGVVPAPLTPDQRLGEWARKYFTAGCHKAQARIVSPSFPEPPVRESGQATDPHPLAG